MCLRWRYEVHCKEGPLYRPVKRVYCGEAIGSQWKRLSGKGKVFPSETVFTKSGQ